jgi:hypothetical protein
MSNGSTSESQFRRHFVLSGEEAQALAAAIVHDGNDPERSNVNALWMQLGETHGFIWTTVDDVRGEAEGLKPLPVWSFSAESSAVPEPDYSAALAWLGKRFPTVCDGDLYEESEVLAAFNAGRDAGTLAGAQLRDWGMERGGTIAEAFRIGLTAAKAQGYRDAIKAAAELVEGDALPMKSRHQAVERALLLEVAGRIADMEPDPSECEITVGELEPLGFNPHSGAEYDGLDDDGVADELLALALPELRAAASHYSDTQIRSGYIDCTRLADKIEAYIETSELAKAFGEIHEAVRGGSVSYPTLAVIELAREAAQVLRVYDGSRGSLAERLDSALEKLEPAPFGPVRDERRELLNHNEALAIDLTTAGELLGEAGLLFREYERSHLDKVEKIAANGGRVAGGPSTAEATAKAGRNAEIATRIEAFIAAAGLRAFENTDAVKAAVAQLADKRGDRITVDDPHAPPIPADFVIPHASFHIGAVRKTMEAAMLGGLLPNRPPFAQGGVVTDPGEAGRAKALDVPHVVPARGVDFFAHNPDGRVDVWHLHHAVNWRYGAIISTYNGPAEESEPATAHVVGVDLGNADKAVVVEFEDGKPKSYREIDASGQHGPRQAWPSTRCLDCGETFGHTMHCPSGGSVDFRHPVKPRRPIVEGLEDGEG